MSDLQALTNELLQDDEFRKEYEPLQSERGSVQTAASTMEKATAVTQDLTSPAMPDDHFYQHKGP